MIRKTLIGLLILFLLMQFIRIDKTNPTFDPKEDFLEAAQVDPDVASVIRRACYDCHSNQTEYPWYSNVAPVSWILKDHIDEGREELNFSEWTTYPVKKQQHKLEECYEMVEEGEMPLKGYTVMHANARLTDGERGELGKWFMNASRH